MFLERLEERKKSTQQQQLLGRYRRYFRIRQQRLQPRGIRVGGEGGKRRAFQVASERKFRDFRQDNTLDTRQFQMAFRRLRQFSAKAEDAKTEFDIDGTIRETCDNAGKLKVVYDRPRKNTVKVFSWTAAVPWTITAVCAPCCSRQ